MRQDNFLKFSKPVDVSPFFLDGTEFRCGYTRATCAVTTSDAIKIELTHGEIFIQLSRSLLDVLSLGKEAIEKVVIEAAMAHMSDAIENMGGTSGMNKRLVLDSRMMLENCSFALKLPDEFFGIWFFVELEAR